MIPTLETEPILMSEGEVLPTSVPVITGEDVALLGVGSAGTVLVVLVGGSIAGNAVLLSLLTVGGGAILWIKTPKTVGEIPGSKWVVKVLPLTEALKKKILAFQWKAALLRHELLLDLGISLGVVALLGTTLTGLVAAGLTGLSVSVLLRLSNIAKKLGNNVDVFKTRLDAMRSVPTP